MTGLPPEPQQPGLPDDVDWPPRTVDWWAVVGASTVAKQFIDVDWQYLLDTALLHAAVWGSGDFTKLPELRIREAEFGFTPTSRARLKSYFEDESSNGGTALDELASRRRAAGRPNATGAARATRTAK